MAAASVLGALALGVTAVGTGISVASSLAMADQQRAVAKANAKAATQRAAIEEQRLREDRRRKLATARAKYGASGVSMTGSPLDVMADQFATAEQDALLVRYGGAAEAGRSLMEGSLAAAQSTGQAIGAGFSGASSILGGTSSLLKPEK